MDTRRFCSVVWNLESRNFPPKRSFSRHLLCTIHVARTAAFFNPWYVLPYRVFNWADTTVCFNACAGNGLISPKTFHSSGFIENRALKSSLYPIGRRTLRAVFRGERPSFRMGNPSNISNLRNNIPCFKTR